MKNYILVLTTILLLSGCAGQVISTDTLAEIDPQQSFLDILKSPLAYKGSTVLLGGVIVKATNKSEGTLLEVYQTMLNRNQKPINIDDSHGRFLALYKGFLDSEVYRSGRRVTIAGVVQGEETMKLGEVNYRYPYLIIKEINLFQEEKPIGYDPYYPYHYGYPWYPYDPWLYPRYRHRYYPYN